MDAANIKVNVEVKNLKKLIQLIEQAEKESAQLQRTIEQIHNFEIDIEFRM